MLPQEDQIKIFSGTLSHVYNVYNFMTVSHFQIKNVNSKVL